MAGSSDSVHGRARSLSRAKRVRLTTWSVACGIALPGAAIAALLPSPAADAGTAERARAQVELGRRLFLDPSVSRAGRFSCASCHDPEHGFSDPRRFSEDETGRSRRHSQPLTDLAGRGFHWDGEFDTVRQLLVTRLAPRKHAVDAAIAMLRARFDASASAVAEEKQRGAEVAADDVPDRTEFDRRTGELRINEAPPYYGPVTPDGLPEVTAIADRLNQDGRYASLFRAATGSATASDGAVIDAIGAYLSTLRTTESAYDRHLRGDETALSPAAKRGLATFEGKAACASCHTAGLTTDGTRLTDGKFHNTGVAFRDAKIEFRQGVVLDGGLGMQSFLPRDLGRFKTPSLRDVAVRPPYMHDGAMATLEEVVDYYARGGTPNGRIDAHVKPFPLSPEERSDLVEFLTSLTGKERAGLGDRPAHFGRTTEVRVTTLSGAPAKGLSFVVKPAGDRFRGVERTDAVTSVSTDARRIVTTDSEGVARFAFPPTTHAELECGTHELGLSRLLPDCAERVTLIATPRDKVSLRVVFADGEVPRRLQAVRVGAVRTESADLSATTDFLLVRTVGKREGLYVAAAPSKGDRRNVQIYADRKLVHAARDSWELDLAGGASETIDLRDHDPDPELAAPDRRDGEPPSVDAPNPEPPGPPEPPAARNPGEEGPRPPVVSPPGAPRLK